MALDREHGARFERLADFLGDARDRQHLRVLLFTSCHRAEGRTTLVLTLGLLTEGEKQAIWMPVMKIRKTVAAACDRRGI